MDLMVTVSSNNNKVNLWVQNGNISSASLRSAFLLERHIPIRFSQLVNENLVAIPCTEDGVFQLIKGWNRETKFSIEWNDPVPAPAIEANYDLVQRCRKYMMYLLITETDSTGQYVEGTVKKCVTVANSNFAFTAGQCLPKTIEKNFVFKVYDSNDKGYDVKVVYVEQNDEYIDFAILEIVTGNFPFYPIGISSPFDCCAYFVLGYDGDYPRSEYLSYFEGRFRNCTISDERNVVIGSPGTTNGCSGGGVFSQTGQLLGIVIAGRLTTIYSNMPLNAHLETLSIKLGEPSYTHIVPALYIKAYMPRHKKNE